MNIEPISSNPKDITISLEKDSSTQDRKIFVIQSISRKSGEYLVRFKSNCGGETFIKVKVS